MMIFCNSWTVFIYMAADNGLHSFAINDIIEMQKGLLDSIDNPKIIVYIDHISTYKNGVVEYLEITPNDSNQITSKILKSNNDENSGSGETLLKFLNWAYSRHASEKNALVIWSHSSGWLGKGIEEKWICSDNTSDSAISISNGELLTAFMKHNKKYDIIILDACNAGSIEFIFEVNDYIDYAIASPDQMPAEGFPWTNILQNWDNSFTPFQTSELFFNNFVEAYSLGGIYNLYGSQNRRASLSVYNTFYLDDVVDSITDFSHSFSNSKSYEFFQSIRRIVPTYNFLNADIDLGFFINAIREENPFDTHVDIVINDLINNFDNMISFKQGLSLSHHPTISIWYPNYFEMFNVIFHRDWSHLRFFKSDWARFLNYAYGEDIYPPMEVFDVEW